MATVYRTNSPTEFEQLKLNTGDIEVWLMDKETSIPIKQFRRSEFEQYFEKIRGYMCKFSDNVIYDFMYEQDKINFTHVGHCWWIMTNIDNHRTKLTIENGEIKIYEVNKRSLSEHLVEFDKLHYNEKEKLVKLLDKTKKVLLKEIKTELLRNHVEKLFVTKGDE